MTKAHLLRFALPKKQNSPASTFEKIKLANKAQPANYDKQSGAKITSNNKYAQPDRFARARFTEPRFSKNYEKPYRSRAAFKLIEIEQKYRICKGKKRILDLGAAPGSWLQVASAAAPKARILGIDQKEIEPFEKNKQIITRQQNLLNPSQEFTQGFASQELASQELASQELASQQEENLQHSQPAAQKLSASAEQVLKLLGGKPDCILSDLAPNTIGQAKIDNERQSMLVKSIMPLVYMLLATNGEFLAKLRHAADEKKLIENLQARFAKVKLIKPQASRKFANEIYVLARGFESK